jgi:N-acetylglucosamine-6-phosphate deacetylase
MEATPEAFEAICRFHASGGTTALALTTITAPIDDIVAVLRLAADFRKKEPTGARLLGIHVEGPYFSKEKPGAHLPELICNPSPEHYKPLLEWATGTDNVMIQMTLAPELPGALGLIDALRERGVRVSGGHTNAWDDEACAGFVHGMEGATHTFNCMSTARRRGPYREAGMLEFALSEPGIVCELIADAKHVSTTLIRMLYFAKGPDGICLITDATSGAGLAEGTTFELGEIKCVVRDGVCLLADGSALAGSAATMGQCVRTMVKEANISLVEAIRMATLNPAKALKLPTKGVLQKGADADLVILSDDLEVAATYVQGRLVYSRS